MQDREFIRIFYVFLSQFLIHISVTHLRAKLTDMQKWVKNDKNITHAYSNLSVIIWVPAELLSSNRKLPFYQNTTLAINSS